MQNSWIKDYKKALHLSAPLMAAMLAQRGMDLVNTLMISRIGHAALAANVLALAIFVLVLIFFIGLQSASGVLIARAYGAHDDHEIKNTLSQAIYLALFLSPLAMLLLWFLPEFLINIGEDPAVVALTEEYFHAVIWSIPPIALFFAFRDFVSALSHTQIVFWISLLTIPLTIFFNYLLIFGHGGFSAMGMAGMGYATSIVEWICTLSLIAYVVWHPSLSIYLKFSAIPRFCWPRFKEILALGWPVSINMGFEWGMFSVTTLMMGHFGVLALAAHQIALQLAAMAFMLPLGISQGTAILVGQSMGAKDLYTSDLKELSRRRQGESPEHIHSYVRTTNSVENDLRTLKMMCILQAKRFTWVNLGLGLTFAGLTAILFFSCSKFLIHWFIDVHDPENMALMPVANTYLKVMALFQLLDAVQVIMTGALRGLKDTFVPMVLGLVSYWLIGLASGYYFAFVLKWNGVGLWWGLGVGIGVSGLLLWVRFLLRIRRG